MNKEYGFLQDSYRAGDELAELCCLGACVPPATFRQMVIERALCFPTTCEISDELLLERARVVLAYVLAGE